MKMKKLSLTTCFFLLTLAVGLCLSFGTALTTAAGLLKNFRSFAVTGAVRVMERTVDEVYSRREDCLAAAVAFLAFFPGCELRGWMPEKPLLER